MDLQGAIRELWRLVRPNGLVAITIWGRGLFEPADSIFWEAVRREDPELYRSIKPWSNIFEPDPLRASCSSAVSLTLKPRPKQDGIRSGRRKTGGQSRSTPVTDPP